MKRFRQILITVVTCLLLFSSTAYSDTWTKNKRLTWNSGESGNPAIAVDGPNIYVVWHDDTPGNDQIYFKKSDDGGTTWTKNKRLTWNVSYYVYPAIAVDGSNIYVVWQDDTPGYNEIYFKKSDDGGTTWTKNKRLTWNAGSSDSPSIAVNGSNIYVVWFDDTSGNDEIYFKKSDDGGTTWTKNKRLTWNAGDSQCPDIAVDGQNVYIVWHEYTPNKEIFFKESTDGGDTWTANKRLTWNSGRSWKPRIAVDGPNIYVVWEDDTPGNYEIYFKKGSWECLDDDETNGICRICNYFPLDPNNQWIYTTGNRFILDDVKTCNSGVSGILYATNTYEYSMYIQNKERGLLSAGCQYDEGVFEDRGYQFVLIPSEMQIGKTVCQYAPPANDHPGAISCITLTGLETITVPAGTFDNTLKIELMVVHTDDSCSYETTLWLAKDIGPVKIHRTNPDPPDCLGCVFVCDPDNDVSKMNTPAELVSAVIKGITY
jgi:glutaredoxin